MSEEIRVNRPQQFTGGQPMMQQSPEPRSGSKMPWVVLALVVVVIVLVGFLFRDKLFGAKNTASMPKASGYEAVFLTNGQVYFGKIAGGDRDYMILNDIYYLQVGPQQGSGTGEGGQPTAQEQQSITLVKLGNELHGPMDEMHISRSQILFYEDLKEDGSVVKAIASYKANPNGTAPAPAPQAAPSPAPAQ